MKYRFVGTDSKMRPIKNLKEVKEKLLEKIQELHSTVKELSSKEVANLRQGVDFLSALRVEIYEDLNQLQHEGLLLRGATWLEENYADLKVAEWHWHPHQSSGPKEPDLRGQSSGQTLVSAEATASAMPQGSIRKRMGETLKKLNEMEGSRYYFVATPEMEQAAKKKADKERYDITVVRL